MALGTSKIFALSGVPSASRGTQTKRGLAHFTNYMMPKALLQSSSLSFTPADDAHIFNSSPSNNYGSATTLQVDDSPVKHFLLKFDVTGVNSQTVTNAKVCLYNVDGALEEHQYLRPAQAVISITSVMIPGRKTCPEWRSGIEGNRNMEQYSYSRYTSPGFIRCSERKHLV